MPTCASHSQVRDSSAPTFSRSVARPTSPLGPGHHDGWALAQAAVRPIIIDPHLLLLLLLLPCQLGMPRVVGAGRMRCENAWNGLGPSVSKTRTGPIQPSLCCVAPKFVRYDDVQLCHGPRHDIRFSWDCFERRECFRKAWSSDHVGFQLDLFVHAWL